MNLIKRCVIFRFIRIRELNTQPVIKDFVHEKFVETL